MSKMSSSPTSYRYLHSRSKCEKSKSKRRGEITVTQRVRPRFRPGVDLEVPYFTIRVGSLWEVSTAGTVGTIEVRQVP